MTSRGVTGALYCLAVGAMALVVWLSFASELPAQELRKPHIARESTPPDLSTVVEPENRMRPIVVRYAADLRDMMRIYPNRVSSERLERMEQFFTDWKAALKTIDFNSLNQEGRVDYIMLNKKLEYELWQLGNDKRKIEAALEYVPFKELVIGLDEARRRFEVVEGEASAAAVEQVATMIAEKKKEIEAAKAAGTLDVNLETASEAIAIAGELCRTLEGWFTFYNGYDPMFTWWVKKPYELTSAAMKEYTGFLEKTLKDFGPDRPTVVGVPAGREFLQKELDAVLIPYTPEQIVAIGEAEYNWCIEEYKKAAQELGFGDDWKAALNHVKNLYAEPGKMPYAVAKMAFDAVDFIREHDLMTLDQMAVDSWQMMMMSLERQRVNPFYTGGPVISVSFPTDEMDHTWKLQSMRGNNLHTSLATAHHELVPGHHMQSYTYPRWNQHRSWTFSTPFWFEGWPLYWEMLLYEQGFAKTPENRIGFLFWRMHRAARIVFSFKFHLGLMTAQECIDMLVNEVGHEQSTAEGEVRRSFETRYNPVYQAAYMVGGLQIRALRDELVTGGKMSYREFHDTIMHNNNMPIELVRAMLTGAELTPDYKTTWKFYGEVEPIK